SYDRSLAFQSTESALRAAEATIANSANLASLAGESCMSTTLCDVIPADNAAGWTSVDAAFQMNKDLLPGNAQYFIQLMSEGAPSELPEQSGSAALSQYGAGSAPVARSFRITARSHAPGAGDGRALVYLQTIVRVER
ncbi:pilus assembly PilX family protein, partial [Craterilacuibacter sp.]|uniref:pilus assembly PilX family protein n=1 Tax=Craterilacuibacter sp. TaxID=2870909 RepID=UPI003F3A4447